MPHRRAAGVVVSLVALALAVPAPACFSSATTEALSEAGDDATGALDAPVAPDGTADSTTEAGDAASSDGEAGEAPDAEEAGEATTVDAVSDTGSTADVQLDADVDAALPVDGSPDASLQSISALLFDGVSDYVHLPAAAGGASETAFSVELWFRATGATGNMFEVYNGGQADRFLSLNGGKVCFYVYSGGPVQVCTTAATYADSAWHHAAGTLGSGGTLLYVDGALAASSATTTSSSFNADTDFRLGMGHTGYASAIVYFQGELDEVRVWSVERFGAEIAANRSQTVSPATAGLQGYWKLDETGAASVTADATSGAHDGQLTNFTFTPSPWLSPGAF